jgi:hypothetical protein
MRQSGSQRPRLSTSVACGRARRFLVVGRHQFDLTNGWEGHPPASDHVVVVSHRPRPTGWQPEASYHFATSAEEGIARAQALSLGLIDHVAIDIVPVVFGRGSRTSGRSLTAT